jgi:delta24(24(1))-sterol reductase
MLLWWNVVLPFVYSATSFVVAETDPRLSLSTTALLWVTLLSAYYVWDVAQAQRVTFRARRVAGGNQTKTKTKTNENEYDAFRVPDDGADDASSALAPPGGLPSRPWAFPKLPWSELRSPTFLETRGGGALLTSGFTGMAWKAHYTADFCMALVWAFSSGGSPFSKPAAFFYPAFFAAMIAHRETRRGASRNTARTGAGSARRCRTSGSRGSRDERRFVSRTKRRSIGSDKSASESDGLKRRRRVERRESLD